MDQEQGRAGPPNKTGTSARVLVWWRVGVVAVLVISAAALSHRIGAPFTGWHEWNSAWYSYFARNHLQYGLGYTVGLCTHGHTEEAPKEASRYLSHPPLIAIWVAVPMAVFGDHEWACRLVPIVCTLGSALLVMVMARRLAPRDPPELGAVLSVLVGLCYVVLPITAYFGRMIDHVPVGQFFCLLMLHGYAQWCGLYGERRRGLGAAWYVVGCVCGIGTAWAAAIMAGLIWWWHVVRMIRSRGGWGVLVVLTLVPAAALAAVAVQILWALGWDASLFWPLLATRSFGTRPEMPQPVLEWLRILGAYWRMNYTLFGAVAVGVYAVGVLVCAAMRGGGPVRRLFRARGLRTVFGLAALQGLIFVVAFKNQSWIHEYWQYFMAPAVAFCLGAVICAVYLALRRVHILVGAAAAVALVVALLPKYTEGWRDSFWANWQEYHERRHIPDEYVEAFELLNDAEAGVEPFAPVMTFRNWRPYEDSFGEYMHSYMQPQIAYYARRPLIFEQKLSAVLANEVGAAAYVLEMNVPESARARVEAMAAELKRRFETQQVGGQLIVFLRRPIS
ncbi:MAG: glycosyltransferase family 39 protein [Phycisphaerales bacterium]|nr:MAG: glycosyltransferase family 39 protein [Phycisphaerales bacterium]